MPIYAIKCNHCGHSEDVYRSVANYNDLPEHCGEKMGRMLTAPFVQADIQGYQSQATGEYIQSRSAHREHLKKHGLIELGNEKISPPSQPKPDPTIKRDIINAVNSVMG
jgi:predicted nucleic acid-binding Zn ribbon protein